jgi:hypothetical protein
MGDVIPFKRPKPAKAKKGITLCKSGFHRWEVDRATRFDVKLGKLITVFRCARCGATKNEAR